MFPQSVHFVVHWVSYTISLEAPYAETQHWSPPPHPSTGSRVLFGLSQYFCEMLLLNPPPHQPQNVLSCAFRWRWGLRLFLPSQAQCFPSLSHPQATLDKEARRQEHTFHGRFLLRD